MPSRTRHLFYGRIMKKILKGCMCFIFDDLILPNGCDQTRCKVCTFCEIKRHTHEHVSFEAQIKSTFWSGVRTRKCFFTVHIGSGNGGVRTHDNLVVTQVLSQLSYASERIIFYHFKTKMKQEIYFFWTWKSPCIVMRENPVLDVMLIVFSTCGYFYQGFIYGIYGSFDCI